jgi:hypothetical protein
MSNEVMTANEQIPIRAKSSDRKDRELESILSSLQGVESLRFDKDRIHISFYPQLISLQTIKTEIEKAGMAPEPKRRKGFFARYLDRMIESNRKSFGNGRLDCCDLNSKKTPKTPR